MKYIYTHRGTKKHIQECLDIKRIKANEPRSNCIMGLLFDHNKSCFWVSTGRPSLWNYIASGMIQYVFSKNPRKYYIVFEATEKATYPSGLFKKLFFKAQRVFEYDIELNEKNILHYEDGRNKKSSM